MIGNDYKLIKKKKKTEKTYLANKIEKWGAQQSRKGSDRKREERKGESWEKMN